MDMWGSACKLMLAVMYLFGVPSPNLCVKSTHDKLNMSKITTNSTEQMVAIEVDAAITIANLSHFWESTGFCPPDPHQDAYKWFLGRDLQQNLALISSIPNDGIKQVRIHWLLDMVKISGFQNDLPVYDFTHLDKFILSIWTYGLKPGFELMGNPSNYFTDFENKTQVYMWKDFIGQVAKRFIDEYGLSYVSSWNFETWNEPRKNGDFDGLNFTLKGLLNYYDACSEGLKAASPELKLGGPGGECHDYNQTKSYCWGLLDHTQNGINYFTGKKGTRIDFVSIHKKGEEPNNSDVIMEKELQSIADIKTHLPGLKETPIFNDEGDPLVRWSEDKWWRADVTYAAMVVKIITRHQNEWIAKSDIDIDYELLSNDNGFLSYKPYFFTQRTLLARFQINTTHPTHVQFVRKPIHTVMGMLSLLGDKQIKTRIKLEKENKDQIGTIASIHTPDATTKQDSWQMTVVVYNSADSANKSGSTNVQMTFTNMPSNLTDVRMVMYMLNNNKTNPHKVWQQAGKPPTPTVEQLRAMRKQEDAYRIKGPVSINISNYTMITGLPLPGVLLYHVCAKPVMQPDQPTNVMITNITFNQILLVWSDHCINSKCLKTYEVEYSTKDETGPFQRINAEDTIFTAFVFAPLENYTSDGAENLVIGFYRIRAIDFWGRPGEYSLVTPFGI